MAIEYVGGNWESFQNQVSSTISIPPGNVGDLIVAMALVRSFNFSNLSDLPETTSSGYNQYTTMSVRQTNGRWMIRARMYYKFAEASDTTFTMNRVSNQVQSYNIPNVLRFSGVLSYGGNVNNTNTHLASLDLDIDGCVAVGFAGIAGSGSGSWSPPVSYEPMLFGLSYSQTAKALTHRIFSSSGATGDQVWQQRPSHSFERRSSHAWFRPTPTTPPGPQPIKRRRRFVRVGF